MKKFQLEHYFLIGLAAFFLALSCHVDYRRAVNYLFSDESVYYMMAQSFAFDQDLKYTQKDLLRVYKDGWHAGPQGVFLTKVADFTLTEQSFQALRQAALPEEIIAKLTPLQHYPIRSLEHFSRAVQERIGVEAFKLYKNLIVQHVETENERIYYSKSFIYALFLAPFLLIFGFNGFLLLNLALLFAMICMGWLYLRQFNASTLSFLVSATFFGLSASFIYTFWITPETFNMFCIALGLFLWLYQREQQTSRATTTLQSSQSGKRGLGAYCHAPVRLLKWLVLTPQGRLYLAPIPIGIACASKLPNALFILPIIADMLVESYHAIFGRQQRAYTTTSAGRPLRWKAAPIWRSVRKLFVICALFWVVFGLLYGLQYVFTEHANPYAGDRKTFYGNFPMTADDALWDKGIRLSNDDYFEKSFYFAPKIILYNMMYYVFGRFTGIMPYFFCAFLALYYFFRGLFFRTPPTTRRFVRNMPEQGAMTRRRILLLLTVAASIFAYIFMAPSNYQGGGGAFGNRFFLNIYPAFLFLITGMSGIRPLMISWCIGSLFLAQSLLNPFQTSWSPAFHAFHGAFRLLPVEWTLVDTLPTTVNPHMVQVSHHEEPPFRVYFVDNNVYDMHDNMFGVRGERTAHLAMRAYKPQQSLAVTLTNGPVGNQVDITVAGETQTLTFEKPYETKRLIFTLERAVPYFDNEVYPIEIRSHSGYIPKFTLGSGLNLSSSLGCRVKLSFSAFELGRGFLEQGQPRRAIEALEPLLVEHPEHIDARHLLAVAYQQAGMAEEAERELRVCERQLAEFRDVLTYRCDAESEACASERIRTEAPEDAGRLARLMRPLTRRYEAEALSHAVGTVKPLPGASGEEVVTFQAAVEAPGYLVYGPFSEYHPGAYQARFRLKTQAAAGTSQGPACFIEVFHPKQGVLERSAIPLNANMIEENGGYYDYTLNFDFDTVGLLEFRVHTTKFAEVSVDRIDVYPRLPLRIYKSLAEVKMRQGAFKEASDYLEALYDVDPWDSSVQRDRLAALAATGEWERAQEFLAASPLVSSRHTGIASLFAEKDADLPPHMRTYLENCLQQFTPQIALETNFAGKIGLLGYNISSTTLHPGERFSMAYFWKAFDTIEGDYSVRVHFIRKGDFLVSETTSKIKRRLGIAVNNMFQQNHQPLNGAHPTSRWMAHELIREDYELIVPPELEPGTYEIRIGLWNPLSKSRLESDEATNVKIGELEICPKNGSNG